jgi:hypothetical protein
LLFWGPVGLSNGFITANLPLIQGEYGLTPSEAAWLPAAYVMALLKLAERAINKPIKK